MPRFRGTFDVKSGLILILRRKDAGGGRERENIAHRIWREMKYQKPKIKMEIMSCESDLLLAKQN